MHFIDVMATCIDLAGARYPLERNGTPIIPLEGQSFKEVLQGRPPNRVGAIFWEHEGDRAIRLGDLKLVAEHKASWELYRMDQDRTETIDLSQRYGSRCPQAGVAVAQLGTSFLRAALGRRISQSHPLLHLLAVTEMTRWRYGGYMPINDRTAA